MDMTVDSLKAILREKAKHPLFYPLLANACVLLAIGLCFAGGDPNRADRDEEFRVAKTLADGTISQEKLAEDTEEARKAAILRAEAHTMKIAESFIASTPKELRKQAEVAAQGEQLVAGTFDATSPNSALVKGQMKAMDEAKKSGMKGADVTEAGQIYKSDTINAAYTSAKENIMMKYGTLDSGEARKEQANLLEKTFQAKGIDTNTEGFQKSSQGQMIIYFRKIQ